MNLPISLKSRFSFTACTLAATLALLSGCGGGKEDDDEGESNSSCSFSVSLSGAVDADIPGGDHACVYSSGNDVGISVGYGLFGTDEVGAIWLDIPEIARGETGEFAAGVTITPGEGPMHSTDDCTVNVSEHLPDPDEVEEEGLVAYVLRGTGSCNTPAVSSDELDASTITLSSFEFSAPAIWRE